MSVRAEKKFAYTFIVVLNVVINHSHATILSGLLDITGPEGTLGLMNLRYYPDINGSCARFRFERTCYLPERFSSKSYAVQNALVIVICISLSIYFINVKLYISLPV